MAFRLGKAGGVYVAFIMWVPIVVCVWRVSNEVEKMGPGPSWGPEPAGGLSLSPWHRVVGRAKPGSGAALAVSAPSLCPSSPSRAPSRPPGAQTQLLLDPKPAIFRALAQLT